VSAFKDAVAADIKGVFLNALEFADDHEVDGNVIKVLVDDDIAEERRGRRGGGLEYADGVFRATKVIYVATEDLPRVPVESELLNLDGENYIVDKVSDNVGMLEITLEANRT
jgi:hypothetical protein